MVASVGESGWSRRGRGVIGAEEVDVAGAVKVEGKRRGMRW